LRVVGANRGAGHGHRVPRRKPCGWACFGACPILVPPCSDSPLLGRQPHFTHPFSESRIGP